MHLHIVADNAYAVYLTGEVVVAAAVNCGAGLVLVLLGDNIFVSRAFLFGELCSVLWREGFECFCCLLVCRGQIIAVNIGVIACVEMIIDNFAGLRIYAQ